MKLFAQTDTLQGLKLGQEYLILDTRPGEVLLELNGHPQWLPRNQFFSDAAHLGWNLGHLYPDLEEKFYLNLNLLETGAEITLEQTKLLIDDLLPKLLQGHARINYVDNGHHAYRKFLEVILNEAILLPQEDRFQILLYNDQKQIFVNKIATIDAMQFWPNLWEGIVKAFRNQQKTILTHEMFQNLQLKIHLRKVPDGEQHPRKALIKKLKLLSPGGAWLKGDHVFRLQQQYFSARRYETLGSTFISWLEQLTLWHPGSPELTELKKSFKPEIIYDAWSCYFDNALVKKSWTEIPNLTLPGMRCQSQLLDLLDQMVLSNFTLTQLQTETTGFPPYLAHLLYQRETLLRQRQKFSWLPEVA